MKLTEKEGKLSSNEQKALEQERVLAEKNNQIVSLRQQCELMQGQLAQSQNTLKEMSAKSENFGFKYV